MKELRENKKKIMIYPSKDMKANKYITNLNNTISSKYQILGFDEIRNSRKILNCDIYHFNWIENPDAFGLKMTIKYLSKKILIKMLKFFNKKIIWTVHNNIPHEYSNKNQTMKFMKFMAKNSDRIHVLCKSTIEINKDLLEKYTEKIFYVPIGDYVGNYINSGINIYERYQIPQNQKIMLFTGLIRRYKNIEILIDAFTNSKLSDSNMVLLICGKCKEKEYEEELKAKIINSKNIYIDFNFIKDEEMKDYIDSSVILVAPYNKASALNSATLSMSMSYYRTMVIPLMGSVMDIENYDEFLYVYDYDTAENHYKELLKCFIRLKNDLDSDINILKEKGIKSYNYIMENYSWDKQKYNWINLYKF